MKFKGHVNYKSKNIFARPWYVKKIKSQNFQKLIKYINRIRHIIPIKENLKKALTDIEYLSDHNKKIV